MLFAGLLGSAVGKPGTACEHVSEAEARAKLGDEPGPARLVDLMLRAGPYGDRFDDAAPGLSLAKLAAAEHGVDLGPLASRLPDDARHREPRRSSSRPRCSSRDVERLRDAMPRACATASC